MAPPALLEVVGRPRPLRCKDLAASVFGASLSRTPNLPSAVAGFSLASKKPLRRGGLGKEGTKKLMKHGETQNLNEQNRCMKNQMSSRLRLEFALPGAAR